MGLSIFKQLIFGRVLSITLDSQPGPAFGKTVLATAVYAPDGKSVSGSDDWTWSTLQATPRGLTAQELKIQCLWGEMREQFQANGFTDEGRLTAAITKKMGSSGVFVGKAKQPSFHSENDG